MENPDPEELLRESAAGDDDQQKTGSFLDDNAPAPWPVLKEGALYGPAGDLVRLATAQSEADPAAVLLTALTYAGATFGADIYMSVGETRHPPRLYTVLVGASSRARKGTATDPVMRGFRLAQQDIDGIPPVEVTDGPLSSGEGIVYAVRDPSDTLDKDGNPADPGVSDKRLLVVESEYGGSLKAMAREGNTLSAILRGAYDHGNIAPLTKTARVKASGAHISYVGHITRPELSKLLSESDVWNGLANRNLWVCVRRPKKVALPQPMDLDLLLPLTERIAAAIAHAHRCERVSFRPDTIRIWPALYERLSDDREGVYGAVTARAEAQVIRLAQIFALLDCSAEISPDHLRAALCVWDFCDASAKFIFGETEDDPIKNRILQTLKERDLSQTAINRMFSGHISSTKLKTKLQELDAAGKVRQYTRGGGQHKGRATVIWQSLGKEIH